MSQRPPQAAVIGDAEAGPGAVEAGRQVGAMLARHGITVVTGGRGGIMEAACQGAVEGGGLTVGILPGPDPAGANRWCHVVVPTNLGYARNAVNVLAGDFVIAIGGGAGTLSELCFAWAHGRPILTLKGHGGWADRLQGQDLDRRKTSTIRECASLDELEKQILATCRGRGLETR